jgi:hypothetical protein
VVFRSIARFVVFAGSLSFLGALRLGAQESTRQAKTADPVPESAQPPAGLCRVWLANVPASQQPAATDCATAIKNRPANARVLFGDLSGDDPKAPRKGSSAPAAQRTTRWPMRMADPARRFDTGPGIPNRPNRNEGAGGVRPVNATAPAPRRPSADSGRNHRP